MAPALTRRQCLEFLRIRGVSGPEDLWYRQLPRSW
jgi:hypothetical protein